jgi:mannitol/fructose-specific phosphotransferase system IIA component (Ntr-type)
MSTSTLSVAPTLSVADFTSPELMVPELRGRDAPTVIRELCAVLHNAGRVPDPLGFCQAVFNREFLLSTANADGTAFPHARVSGLSRMSLAVGRSPEPFRWGSQAPGPVRVVLLCAVPATEATAYLLLMSGLVRWLRQEGSVATLVNAGGTAGIVKVLSRIPLRPHRLEAGPATPGSP